MKIKHILAATAVVGYACTLANPVAAVQGASLALLVIALPAFLVRILTEDDRL